MPGILCVVLAPSIVTARDCLMVRATDPDGLPVIGARAELGQVEALMGPNGRAELCGAAPGSTLTVSAKGFEPFTVVPRHGATEIEALLEIAGRVETPVVVTGVINPRKAAVD